jgi:acyl-CoA thioester hydrolase
MIYLKNEKFYHETQIRVRYAETDRMGYSYYGNYPTYYEVGRTEFIRELGLSYKQLEDDGYLLPIVNMSIKYIKPALYDDLLTVRTYYKKFHTIKVEFEYEIINQNHELINTGQTLLAFVNSKTRKPTQAPEYYLKIVRYYFDQIKKEN